MSKQPKLRDVGKGEDPQNLTPMTELLSRKTAKHKGRGRPKINIDWDLVERLCNLQCSLDEISYAVKLAPETIERRCKREQRKTFSAFYDEHSTAGKIALRRYQYQHAQKNVAMAIFLGKQWLGQFDEYGLKVKGNLNILRKIDPSTLSTEALKRIVVNGEDPAVVLAGQKN